MRPGRPPRSGAEVVRNLARQVNAQENASTLRLGKWVLSVDGAGEIVATAPGRTVNLTAPLAAAETRQRSGLHRTYTVTAEGSPTGGAFRLRFLGAWTDDIDHDATSSDVRTALLALNSRYSTLDFNVTGSAGGPWTVIVPDLGPLSGDGSGLTGGTNMGITID